MEFNINEVLYSIFRDARKELDNMYGTAQEKHSEYMQTYAPDLAEKKWADLQAYHKECKASIVRTGTRKVQEVLLPIRDFFDKSLAEFDPALIERVSGIAALAGTETEYNCAARIAGNSYWALVVLSEKAPDEFKDKVSRPDIEQYRFLLDGLENRIERTLANYEGSGTFIDSAAQIANVDARTMFLFIQQALEKIDSISPAFFTFDKFSNGECLTPAEKERIAELAETEFTGPACDPDNIGNSILDYIERNPADKSMVMRSKFGPIATAYEQEFAEARRLNASNRQVHNIVWQMKK